MSDPLVWKQGDSGNTRTIVLTAGDGEAAVLVGATVRWHMTQLDGTTVVDAAALVVSAADGQVARDRDPAVDTANPGRYRVEVEVTYADGAVQTFPEDGYVDVVVLPQLA